MTILTSRFFRRLWFYFRQGHGIYLIFFMSFANFILIGYNFAIKKSPLLSEIFENTMLFAVIFIVIYIPLSILIGYLHRKHQLTVEQEVSLQENWMFAWFIHHLVRQYQGKTTPEEDNRILGYLENILKSHKKHHLIGDPTQEESEKSGD